ncbi:unnamed protein product [Ixodes persulcatus]
MGKEAVPWPATVHANGIHHKTAEQLHRDIMRDAVKFSNSQPRSFAQQLSTQGGKDDLEHPFYVVDIDDLFYRMDLWRKSIPRAAPYYGA